MKWGTWKKIGSFGGRHPHVDKFLGNILQGAAKLNGRCYVEWGDNLREADYPFRHPERCWTGLVAAALAAKNPCFMGEMPVMRAIKTRTPAQREESNGRADYWTYVKRSGAQGSDIALELKWHYLNYRGNSKERKDIARQWAVVSQQAESALGHMKQSKGDFENPVSVAVLVLFVYEISSNPEGSMDRKDAKNLITDILEKQIKQPDLWLGAWYPPGGAAVLHHGKDFERCPVVYFLAQAYA